MPFSPTAVRNSTIPVFLWDFMGYTGKQWVIYGQKWILSNIIFIIFYTKKFLLLIFLSHLESYAFLLN